MSEIMDEMEFFDFSFLEEEDGIRKFVDDLYSFHVLIMKNEDKDMVAVRVMSPEELSLRLNDFFGSGVETVQMIVKNGKEDPLCPFFMMIMSDYKDTFPINFKLETFFRTTGILGIHARCSKAIVTGLMSQEHTNSMIDIPVEYHCLSIPSPSLRGTIDLYSHHSTSRNKCLEKLMDVPGMPLIPSLPYCLHWNIFKYLRHPCAVMIQEHRQRMLFWMAYWDNHFELVFNRVPSW